jgi:hypothetical protein
MDTRMEMSGQLHARAPGTLFIGVWVGTRASLDAVAKRETIPSLPLSGIVSRSSSL